MKTSEAILLIEQTMGFNMSDEQRSILVFGHGSPTLINSCAGAGKTTTLMMSILYNALVNEIDPKYVLGITFSKRAQLDMENKYQRILKHLVVRYEPAKSWGKPTFKTFHSLFLQLMKKLDKKRSFNVVGVGDYQRDLYKKIKHPVAVLSRSENIARFTDVASKLVNFGYSSDGLDVNQDNPQVKVILKNLQQAGESPIQALLKFMGHGDEDYWQSYHEVISYYHELKDSSGGLDFDDMQAQLKDLLATHAVKKKLAQRYLEQYQLLYLDEFQDINPLQWSLMQDMLADDDYNHLVAIGDDDQSIYAFRGSDATFILNFTKVIPRAQKFTLSTNYRTKTEILNIVKPMIESNTLRLDKSLKAYENGGKIYCAVREYSQSKLHDDALAKLMLDIQADSDQKQRFAILSRTNLNLSLLTDQLADYGVYFNLGKTEQILQNTKVYQILVWSMKIISDNDFEGLKKVAKYFGFSHYRKFVKSLQYQSIDEYLHDSGIMKVADFKEIHDNLLSIRERCKQAEFNGAIASQLTKELLMSVVDLTKRYFSYVLSKHFVSYSNEDYQAVTWHLQRLTERAGSLADFYQHESNKRAKMQEVIEQNDLRLQAITMHSSKGLEFDETLIYEPETAVVTGPMLALADPMMFPADLTLKKLKQILIEASSMTAVTWLTQFAEVGLSSVQTALKLAPHVDLYQANKVLQNYLDSSGKMRRDYYAELEELLMDQGFNFDALANDLGALKMLLMELVSNAKDVEEEKRIYYVAVTRAKRQILFDQPLALPEFDQLLNLDQAQPIHIDPTKA